MSPLSAPPLLRRALIRHGWTPFTRGDVEELRSGRAVVRPRDYAWPGAEVGIDVLSAEDGAIPETVWRVSGAAPWHELAETIIRRSHHGDLVDDGAAPRAIELLRRASRRPDGEWDPDPKTVCSALASGRVLDWACPTAGKVGQCWLDETGEWGQAPRGERPVVFVWLGDGAPDGVAVGQTYGAFELPSGLCVPVQRDDEAGVFGGDREAAEALIAAGGRYVGWHVGWHADPDDPDSIAEAGDVWVSPRPLDAGPHYRAEEVS